jgi:hypothetical protein
MTMQAYLNDPSMKTFILRLLHEDHQGLPPIKWPDDPASIGVDYEAQLGIPMTVGVVAQAIWRGAGQAYAHPWPARFFDIIQPGQDLSAVGWQWVHWLFTSRSFPGVGDVAWEAMGERLLALLTAAPLSP